MAEKVTRITMSDEVAAPKPPSTPLMLEVRRIFARWLNMISRIPVQKIIDSTAIVLRAVIPTQFAEIHVYSIDYEGVGELVVFLDPGDHIESVVHSFDGAQTLIATNQSPINTKPKQLDDDLYYLV